MRGRAIVDQVPASSDSGRGSDARSHGDIGRWLQHSQALPLQNVTNLDSASADKPGSWFEAMFPMPDDVLGQPRLTCHCPIRSSEHFLCTGWHEAG